MDKKQTLIVCLSEFELAMVVLAMECLCNTITDPENLEALEPVKQKLLVCGCVGGGGFGELRLTFSGLTTGVEECEQE